MFLTVALAHAHEADASNEADQAFDEARKLFAQGSIAEACANFARSYQLLPRHGTLLNLAVCSERQGQLPAAFKLFQEALSAAVADGRADREELAQAHLDALRSKLSWLTIRLASGADVPGLQVFRDGVQVESKSGNAIPVAVGRHLVSASAPGRESFEAIVELAAGATRDLELPVLRTLPSAPKGAPIPTATQRAPTPPGVPSPSVDTSRPTWRTPLSRALIAVGLAAISVGGVFGVRTILDGSEARQACPSLRCTSNDALSKTERLEKRARIGAKIADIALPVGAAAAGAGGLVSLGVSGTW